MRIYVTGGTGLVGSNVIKVAQERYNAEIIAAQFGPAPEWKVTYELDPLDIGDHQAIRTSIHKYKPDVVIHCAALLDQVFMYHNRATAWSIMVGGTRAFAEACREVSARLIFVSSDWVFDGKETLVDEDSPPFPVNFYGIMKMASERELSMMGGLNYGIARLAGVYGLNYSNPGLTRRDQGLGFDLGNFLIEHLTQGKVAEVWTGPNVNDVAHPTLASDGADMLMRLAQHNQNGIFHCFGREAISRLALAHLFADLFQADHALIAAVPTDPLVLETHRNIRVPFRLRANTQKTSDALGRQAYGVWEGLQIFKQEWDAANR